MTDTGFMFFTFIFGGAMMFLAWMTVDNLKREFRDDSLSSPAPVTPCDTTNKEDN